MAEFSTITVKEVLSRILRLEAQVNICIQNQEWLFQQASNCQPAQECLKLAKDFGDERPESDTRIGGATDVTETSDLCPTPNPMARRNSSPRLEPHQQNAPSPPAAFALTPTQVHEAEEITLCDGDKVGASDEIGDFLREIGIIEPEPSPVPTSLQETVHRELGTLVTSEGPAISNQPQPQRQQQQRQRRQRQRRQNVQQKVCHKCGKSFSTPGHLRRHIRDVCCTPQSARRRRFQCEYCDASCDRRVGLQAHQRLAHGQFSEEVRFMSIEGIGIGSGGTGTSQAAGDGLFACQLCGQSFLDRAALGAHTYTHTHTHTRDRVPEALALQVTEWVMDPGSEY